MIQLDDVVRSAPFSERHTRRVDLPIDVVWPAALSVPADEIRALGPLLRLRQLPGTLLRRGGPTEPDAPAGDDRSLLDDFAGEGFVIVHRDEHPVDGRAVVLFGAAGAFWRPVGNEARLFEDPTALIGFDEPGHAVIAASVEAIDRGGWTELVTETRVRGTDRSSTLKFARYWALIRLPSGLIRRSWLAAIERRALRNGVPTLSTGSPRPPARLPSSTG